MQYMFLIYSREEPGNPAPEALERMESGRWSVITDAKRKGMLVAAVELKSTATATTVRAQDGQAVIIDGPFAETREQLAGYCILECGDLDEAIEWATRIPANCEGRDGCIEIRPVAHPRRP